MKIALVGLPQVGKKTLFSLMTGVPYDQLIREHLAGDLLKKPRINRKEGINESEIGTAFFRLGELGHDDCIRFREIRTDVVDNQIDTLGKAFEGLFPQIESTAKGMGLEMKSFLVTKPEDFEQAFNDIKAWQAQALITYATPLTILARQRIVDFVNANRIPGFFDWRGFVEAGGLFSYGPLVSEMNVQAARQLDRVLRGARPADLPVELPARYEFVINRKTATALDIRIPQELMLRADQVIE